MLLLVFLSLLLTKFTLLPLALVAHPACLATLSEVHERQGSFLVWKSRSSLAKTLEVEPTASVVLSTILAGALRGSSPEEYLDIAAHPQSSL